LEELLLKFLRNFKKIMTFNREKIVFLAPLNWDFLPLPGLA
jgi:hypothetical protein